MGKRTRRAPTNVRQQPPGLWPQRVGAARTRGRAERALTQAWPEGLHQTTAGSDRVSHHALRRLEAAPTQARPEGSSQTQAGLGHVSRREGSMGCAAAAAPCSMLQCAVRQILGLPHGRSPRGARIPRPRQRSQCLHMLTHRGNVAPAFLPGGQRWPLARATGRPGRTYLAAELVGGGSALARVLGQIALRCQSARQCYQKCQGKPVRAR